MVNTNIVLFSGYARLPGGTVSSEIYGVMALVILVDIQTGIIVEAECTLSTQMAENFVQRLLVGKKLDSEIEETIAQINNVYQGSAKRAVITTLRVIADKYLAFKRQSIQ
jgi:hypothetical protein